MASRLHKVTDQKVVKTYKLLPYKEMEEILKKNDTCFFEDSKEQPLKRNTMWKAARRLSERLGKKVVAKRGVLQLNDSEALQGYLFSVEAPQSPNPQNKHD